MTNTLLPPLTLAISLLATVAKAHGYVQGVVADGTYYQGYRPSFQYSASPPVIPSWSDPLNINNGYINDYTSPDIICHLSATPGKTSAPVKAGGSVQLQWTDWPIGHLGPVITYLANCNGNCTTVDKTKLLFNKIDQAGLIQPGPTTSQRWAAQELIANNNSWTVKIPQDIAPGQYVLRHEIISLQEAMVYGGAQNYPQCVNLVVTGSGTNSLQSGTLGTKLYTRDDSGIHLDIYQTLNNYTIPGPQLTSGASNSSQPAVNSTTTVSTSFSRSSTGTSASSVSITSSTSVSSSSSSNSSSVTGSSTTATISITVNLSLTSSSVRTSLSVAGQGFYTVSSSTSSSSVTQTTATSTLQSIDTLSSSDLSLSTTTQTSLTALTTDTTTSFSYSTITAAFSTNATTFQTVTRSDSSISAGVFLGSVSVNVTTTLVKITVTVPGNFADPPLPTNATLSTASSFANTTFTPYPLTNTTLLAPYPFTNATATSLYGTGTAYSTGSLGTAYSTLSGTAYSSGSVTTYSSTSTSDNFVAWIQATTTSAPIDNGYKPRRNVRYVKQRQQQRRWIR